MLVNQLPPIPIVLSLLQIPIHVFQFMGEDLTWLTLVRRQHPSLRRYLSLGFSNSRSRNKDLGICSLFGKCFQELTMSEKIEIVRQEMEKRPSDKPHRTISESSFWRAGISNPIVWDFPKCVNTPYFWISLVCKKWAPMVRGAERLHVEVE